VLTGKKNSTPCCARLAAAAILHTVHKPGRRWHELIPCSRSLRLATIAGLQQLHRVVVLLYHLPWYAYAKTRSSNPSSASSTCSPTSSTMA
jgi:hypothetical protein